MNGLQLQEFYEASNDTVILLLVDDQQMNWVN